MYKLSNQLELFSILKINNTNPFSTYIDFINQNKIKQHVKGNLALCVSINTIE